MSHFKIYLGLGILIFSLAACNNDSKKSANDPTSNNKPIANSASNTDTSGLVGTNWCLDNSVSIYLDDDENLERPATEIYTFNSDGSFNLRRAYKEDTTKIIQSFKGQWHTKRENLTVYGMGETSKVKFLVQKPNLFIAIDDDTTETFFACNL